MDIQKKPTLAEKQAFWAEQLPNFEAKYWLSDRSEFLVFDMEQGNYVVKDDLDQIYEDDANDAFHRVNTGWAMWKKAINFSKTQAIPEGFVLVNVNDLHQVRDMAMNAKYASMNNDNDRIFSDIEDVQLRIEAMIEAQEQVDD